MISVAIDGPSGAGKSTIAKEAAARLGMVYVDTGALYRAIGLYAHENDIPDADESALAPRLCEIEVELVHRGGVQRVMLNGKDVSEDIRRPEMSMAASNVSAHRSVRDYLLDLQRHMAKTRSVIMDGRDIGTVVLPNAELKIFLTASPEVRAGRRHADFAARGESITLEQVLEDIIKRDYNDTHRETAPLRQAEDAVLLDTTGLDFDESVALVESLVRQCLEKHSREI